MSSAGKNRGNMKRDLDDNSAVNVDRASKEEDLEASDKRSRHKASRSRKAGSGGENDGWDSSGRKRCSGDVDDQRKQSGGSTRDDNDDDDRSKQGKKKQEGSALEKLSNWYQDGESEGRHTVRDKSGSKGLGRGDERDRNFSRKTPSKYSDHEGSQSKSRQKNENDQDMDHEKIADIDYRSPDIRESGREWSHGSSDHRKASKRRWDESDAVKKIEESGLVDKSEPRSGKGSDSKHHNSRERTASSRSEFNEEKGKGLDYSSEKVKSNSRDERRVDPERSKSRNRHDASVEDGKTSPMALDDKSSRDRNAKYKEQKLTSRDPTESQDKSYNQEEDGNTWTKEKRVKYTEQNTTRLDTAETRKESFGVEGGNTSREKIDMYKEQKITSVDGVVNIEKPFNREDDANLRMGETSERYGENTPSHDPAEKRELSLNPEEDGKAWPREKNEKYREQQKTASNDPAVTQEMPSIMEEDSSKWMRGTNEREMGHSRRSWTPEKSGRRHSESEYTRMDYERTSMSKRRELENDVYRDDRVRSRDDSLNDRDRDRDGSRENWKRRQPFSNDKDADEAYDRDKEWELPRRGRDRIDNERPLGRSGNRREGRGEAVKASSNIGISTENYDFIEIPLNSSRRSQGQQYDSKSGSQDEWLVPQDDWPRTGGYGFSSPSGISRERHADEGAIALDDDAWRDNSDGQGERARSHKGVARPSGGQSSSSGSQPSSGNHEPSSLSRMGQQSMKGGRMGRGNRPRPVGRDNQHVNMPMPLMGSPFGPLGMIPPVPLQPLNPPMSPAPGPVPPGVFIPPFPSPLVWPGPRGVDLNMLPGVSPVTSGSPGQRFPPNMGTPNPPVLFNQPGPVRGVPPNASSHGFNVMTPAGRGQLNDKASGTWVPPKGGGPPGKAPSRGEQNDYSQNFVDTGMRPQNFIRELELTNVEDYPKLRELIQKKDEIVAKASTAPMYHKCDLREFVLSPEFFGTKFDVILVDPPWEEYVHRAPGTDHMEYWTLEEIMNLKIEAIADTPSFIFLWVGDGVGLEQGRQCLKKWGFRRCEDICWVKTNKHTATPALRHDSHTILQHSKEHCLMGIKGTVRRSTDGHIIHANIDTDVIIAEEPPYGSTAKPEDIYRIIEHFSLGRRRLELFGEDHNIRSGWLTVGKGLSSSNFNSEAYVRNFADKDGKVWQGGGGRNPPPESSHLVLTTPDIEALRPKSPMKNQQQLQQQQSSTFISLTPATSVNRRSSGNSPQRTNTSGLTQEASGDSFGPWVSPMEALDGRGFGSVVPNINIFDMYGHNAPPMIGNGEYLDFESRRGVHPL